MVLLGGVNCAPLNQANQSALNDSVGYDLNVTTDQIFGYTNGASVGNISFSHRKGLVGTRIHFELNLEEWQRFHDSTLQGLIQLDNPNATKAGSYEVTFEVTSQHTDVYFYIPQIRSVPTILNFTMSIFFEQENTGITHQFLAEHGYQFEVNQGLPAT